MRVRARRAFLVDSAIGLVLAVTSWMASYYVWIVDPEVPSAPHGSCEMGLTTSLERLAQGPVSLHHWRSSQTSGRPRSGGSPC
jgi:hypothetical protein